MWVALAINLAMLVVEAVGGILTGSLAVLADAGHLLSDVGSIGLALLAAGLASRPGDARRTFGYQRTEVLAALANGLILVAVAVAVAVAAIGRLGDPPGIDGAGVLALGLVGLAGNLAATLVLAGGPARGPQPRGSAAPQLRRRARLPRRRHRRRRSSSPAARRWSTRSPAWRSPCLILASSWRLIKEPVEVLMEAAPEGLDVEAIGAAICSEEGVRSVHELHVWTVTPGFGALAAHVVVAAGSDRDLTRRRLEVLLHERFEIDHTTLQMEEEAPEALLEVEPAPPRWLSRKRDCTARAAGPAPIAAQLA